MLFYHGTSYESFLNILKEGFKPKEKTWVCSEDDMTYFYGLEALRDCTGYYDCNENEHSSECAGYVEYETIHQASLNGKIAAARKKV